MKTMKNISLVFLIFMVLAPLAAKEITITWDWDAADEQVTHFRYQLNGEEESQWSVVDASVTSFSIGPVEEESNYTLFVQQSYDGIHFGESGVLAYEGLKAEVEEEEPHVAQEEVVETSVVIEEPPVEKSVAVIEVPVIPVEEVPVVAKTYSSRITLTGGAGGKADNLTFVNTVVGNFFDPDNEYSSLATQILPVISLDYIHSNLFSVGKKSSFGMLAGVGYHHYLKGSTYVSGIDAHVAALLVRPISKAFSLDAGVGGAFMVIPKDIYSSDAAKMGMFFGPFARIGAQFKVNPRLSVEVATDARLLFTTDFKGYELTGVAKLGFGYAF